MRWPEGRLRRSDAGGGWAPRTLAGVGGTEDPGRGGAPRTLAGGRVGGTAGRQAPALHVPAWGVRCALLLGVPTAQAPQERLCPRLPGADVRTWSCHETPGPLLRGVTPPVFLKSLGVPDLEEGGVLDGVPVQARVACHSSRGRPLGTDRRSGEPRGEGSPGGHAEPAEGGDSPASPPSAWPSLTHVTGQKVEDGAGEGFEGWRPHILRSSHCSSASCCSL